MLVALPCILPTRARLSSNGHAVATAVKAAKKMFVALPKWDITAAQAATAAGSMPIGVEVA